MPLILLPASLPGRHTATSVNSARRLPHTLVPPRTIVVKELLVKKTVKIVLGRCRDHSWDEMKPKSLKGQTRSFRSLPHGPQSVPRFTVGLGPLWETLGVGHPNTTLSPGASLPFFATGAGKQNVLRSPLSQ